MSLFNNPKFSSPMFGKVTDRHGMSVELPHGWYAIESSDGQMLIASAEKKGVLILTVGSVKYETSELGEASGLMMSRENNFDVLELPQREDETGQQGLRMWQTETDQYVIRFMYIGYPHQLAWELDTVNEIVYSFKPPEKS